MLEQKHGVTSTNSSMAHWRRRKKKPIVAMAQKELVEACNTFDAMIESMAPAAITIDEPIDLSVGDNDTDVAATTGDGSMTEVAMEGNSIPDSPIVSGETITVGFVGRMGLF